MTITVEKIWSWAELDDVHGIEHTADQNPQRYFITRARSANEEKPEYQRLDELGITVNYSYEFNDNWAASEHLVTAYVLLENDQQREDFKMWKTFMKLSGHKY